jgi:hypothetical protein
MREMTKEFAQKLCKHVDDSQAQFLRATKDWFTTRKRRIQNDARRKAEGFSKEWTSSSSSSSGIFIGLTSRFFPYN